MKSVLFIFPLLVIIGVGFMLPILKVAPEPLDQSLLLRYDRVGGIAGFNDHIIITKNGDVYTNDSYAGKLSDNVLQDFKEFLDGNKYSSRIESFYDRYKKSKGYSYPDAMESTLTLNTVSGTIVATPDDFINNMLNPYLTR